MTGPTSHDVACCPSKTCWSENRVQSGTWLALVIDKHLSGDKSIHVIWLLCLLYKICVSDASNVYLWFNFQYSFRFIYHLDLFHLDLMGICMEHVDRICFLFRISFRKSSGFISHGEQFSWLLLFPCWFTTENHILYRWNFKISR